MSRIIGFKRFTSKAGKKLCMLFLETEFSSFDRSNASSIEGAKVETEWLEDDIASKLTAADIGKSCTVNKVISGNRAYITDITIK